MICVFVLAYAKSRFSHNHADIAIAKHADAARYGTARHRDSAASYLASTFFLVQCIFLFKYDLYVNNLVGNVKANPKDF